MGVLEVQIDQNRLATFDGKVLEVFGGSVRRFHINLLTVKISRPDKRGSRVVTLTQALNEASLPLDESQFAAFQPILDAMRDAGVKIAF